MWVRSELSKIYFQNVCLFISNFHLIQQRASVVWHHLSLSTVVWSEFTNADNGCNTFWHYAQVSNKQSDPNHNHLSHDISSAFGPPLHSRPFSWPSTQLLEDLLCLNLVFHLNFEFIHPNFHVFDVLESERGEATEQPRCLAQKQEKKKDRRHLPAYIQSSTWVVLAKIRVIYLERLTKSINIHLLEKLKEK